MTCRCASAEIHAQRALDQAYDSSRATQESMKKEIDKLKAEIASRTADPTKYVILDAYDSAPGFLVVKAQFPSCTKCSFEGTKILVYRNVRPIDAMKWKNLDPHFREADKKLEINSAPSPIARFPGNKEGWDDAIHFANLKAK